MEFVLFNCVWRYEDMRDGYYMRYRAKGHKSLRFDKERNPRLDKVVRLDGYFAGFKLYEIDADAILRFTVDQQSKELANASVNQVSRR